MPHRETIRIAVCDDHPLMRGGIVQCLSVTPDFEVVAEGGSAPGAIDIAQRLLPDVMLIDINMPGDGLVALQRIAETCPAVAIIVITVRDDGETVGHALRLGARGYVLKGVSGDDLVTAIRSVAAGEVSITPTLAARLLAANTTDVPTADEESISNLGRLSTRETEILGMIAKGMINREIAAALGLSEKTVKHYVTNILQKLQVRNRVEAALVAQRKAHSDGE